jgi:histone-arginine methyltransferase CARM1
VLFLDKIHNDSVLKLKPNGKLFPSIGDLYAAPFTDEALYMEQATKANFW